MQELNSSEVRRFGHTLHHQHERSRCCHKAWLGFPAEDMRGVGTEARDLRAQESVEEEGGGGAEKKRVGRGGRRGEKKETLTPVSPRRQRKRERLSTSQEALVITYSSCV